MSKSSATRLARVFLNSLAAAAVVLSALGMPMPARAAAALSITPITWNVVGLDSNNVMVGPENFPVGARVCNTGDTAATNVVSSFVWDPADPAPSLYIALRPGTLSEFSVANGHAIPSLAAGACYDFYYEIKVTRDANAYNTQRQYYITAAADGVGTVTTPSPRRLYVEHLISQSRNSTTKIELDGVEVPPGGTMTMMVGGTYTIKLWGFTATNGYEQIETFINLPNTIFKVNSVLTTYTADTSATVNPPYDKLYGDSCVWENDPASLNYRACLSTGKTGGDITVTYSVTILSMPGTPLSNPEPFTSLIYDFSGSSYHYNADFSATTRFLKIVELNLTKAFIPVSTTPGGTSKLEIRIPNITSAPISGVNFIDPLPTTPGAMLVANPPNATTSNCGTPTFAPTAGANTLYFSYGTIAVGATCVISVDVTVPVVGTYLNTTNHLFFNGTTPGTGTDTGNTASATLTVSTTPPGPDPVCNISMATWNMGTSTTPNPPTALLGSDVSSAAASFTPGAHGGVSLIDSANGNPISSWKSNDYPKTTAPVFGTDSYYQFSVDSTNYTDVTIQVDDYADNNWVQNNYMYFWSSTDGTNWTSLTGSGTEPLLKAAWRTSNPFPAAATGSTTTYFRISALGANNINGYLHLDNVRITGCLPPEPPIISKAFAVPTIIKDTQTTTLTFTITNPNLTAMSNVAFSDTLPVQLDVTSSSGTECNGGTLTITNSNPDTVALSGGSLAAGASCTFSVDVTGNTVGLWTNTTGPVSGTILGKSITGNTATANLNVMDMQANIATLKQVGLSADIDGAWYSTLTIAPNTPVYYRFTAENTGDYDFTALSVSDPTLSGLGYHPDACTWYTYDELLSDYVTTTTLPTASTGNPIAYCIIGPVTLSGDVHNTETLTGTYSGGTVSDTDDADVYLYGSIGNYVWLDLDQDGIQDANEPGIAGATVTLYDWTGIFPLQTTTTNASGAYSFTVVPGNYIVRFTLPGGYTATQQDQGGDDNIDSDASPSTGRTGTITVTSGQVVNNVDAGFYTPRLDLGDLPESPYKTTFLPGPAHIIFPDGGDYIPESYGGVPAVWLGTIVDTETNGQPTTYAKGDDNAGAKDEDGLILPATGWQANGTNNATIVLNASASGVTVNYGLWIDWTYSDGLGVFDAFYNGSGVTTSPVSITVPISVPSGYVAYSSVYMRLRASPNPLTSADYQGTIVNGEVEDYWYRLGPTAVTLVSFSANGAGDAVTLDWETSSEVDNLGFNLYRAESAGGTKTLLNAELIPSGVYPGSPSGATYEFTDTGITKNTTYYYWLEDVDIHGGKTLHGPVTASVKTAYVLKSFTVTGLKNRVNLTWVTTSENNVKGFTLYRSTTLEGRRTRLNAWLIPSRGTNGGTYFYIDFLTKRNQTYYYWLETLDKTGVKTLMGPISVKVK